jgi:hypothetical protein
MVGCWLIGRLVGRLVDRQFVGLIIDNCCWPVIIEIEELYTTATLCFDQDSRLRGSMIGFKLSANASRGQVG